MAEEQSRPNGQKGRPPAIRTMRSDIAEFLRTTKPSLISIIARQAESGRIEPAKRRGRPVAIAIGLALAGAGLIGAGGLALWRLANPTPAAPAASTAMTRPTLTADATSQVTIAPQADELGRAIAAAGSRGEPGSLQHLAISIRRASAQPQAPTAAELFAIIGADPPAGFAASLAGTVELYFHRRSGGAALIIIAEAQHPARALQGLIAWEPSLASDLAPLVPGGLEATIEPFRDFTYRNIDYRYLELDAAADRGIGYLHFPGKRRIVIATSAEALRLAIERLSRER